ncbi:MAG: SufD family Fe-S cluster assembly protein [Nanoarchaeota archaeon]|nr:SufD family Fe-S cluster assembly protein [Nanoarchaeota archaeon]
MKLKYGLEIGFELDLDNDKINKISELMIEGIEFTNNSNKFKTLIEENENTKLHYEKLQSYKVIKINKNLEEPIIITPKGINHLIIITEPNIIANIIINKEDDNYYSSLYIEAFAEENSKLNITNIENQGKDTINFSIHKGEAKRNATINWTNILLGGKFSQLHTETILLEEGAKTSKNTGFFTNNEQQFDINDSTIHKASHTESLMLNRGILNNSSKSIYHGKIHVEKYAKNCTGHQRSENILLDENAKCNAVPILEINNDDISCSHGVNFTTLNEEQLFYLNSRGLDDNLSKEMIILGFIEPIIKYIKDKEKIYKIIKEKL